MAEGVLQYPGLCDVVTTLIGPMSAGKVEEVEVCLAEKVGNESAMRIGENRLV